MASDVIGWEVGGFDLRWEKEGDGRRQRNSVLIGQFPIKPAEDADWEFLYGRVVTFVGV